MRKCEIILEDNVLLVNVAYKFWSTEMKITNNLSSKDKMMWFFLVTGILFFMANYYYVDLEETTYSTLNFLRAIISGKPTDFYSTCYPINQGSLLGKPIIGGVYSVVLYVIFSLWEWPLLIYEYATGNSFFYSFAMVSYSKGILLLFFGLSIWAMYRLIIRVFGNEIQDINNYLFLYASCPLCLYAILVTTTYDIISVFFTIFALYYYLENDKKYLIFFSLAIACKIFAIWIFIPLLLLREKRIWKIIIYFCAGISLLILPDFLLKVICIVSNGGGDYQSYRQIHLLFVFLLIIYFTIRQQ